MATVRMPNSVAARKTRIAISLRFAARSFLPATDTVGMDGLEGCEEEDFMKSKQRSYKTRLHHWQSFEAPVDTSNVTTNVIP